MELIPGVSEGGVEAIQRFLHGGRSQTAQQIGDGVYSKSVTWCVVSRKRDDDDKEEIKGIDTSTTKERRIWAQRHLQYMHSQQMVTLHGRIWTLR